MKIKVDFAELELLLDLVHDEKSFIDFVEALGNDFARERELEIETPSEPYGPGGLGWENARIDTFLEAAAACGRGGALQPLSAEVNSWQRCAQILYGGKSYE